MYFRNEDEVNELLVVGIKAVPRGQLAWLRVIENRDEFNLGPRSIVTHDLYFPDEKSARELFRETGVDEEAAVRAIKSYDDNTTSVIIDVVKFQEHLEENDALD